MTMTPADVRERLGVLRSLNDQDTEAAAVGADQLRIEVLQEIANANPAAIALAKAALATIEEDIGGD